jgi:hypothetical protein
LIKNKRSTITPIENNKLDLCFRKTNILVSDYPKEKLECVKIHTVFIFDDILYEKEKAISTIRDLTKIKIDNIDDIVFIHSKKEDIGDFLYAVHIASK